MKTQTLTTSQSLAAEPKRHTTGSVTSKDGTTIGYRQIGQGLGVVLLHGAMESGQSHTQLAEALADDFTVYLPDRRGRGLSGPYGEGYSIATNIDDLGALLAKTDAQRVFGVSSGGIICLQAALSLPAIQKVAVYEPALSINGSVSTAFLARYDREMAEGKVAAALVTGMKGAEMGPKIFNMLPRWLLELLTSMAMKGEDKAAVNGDVTMRMLAPTLHYDFQLVADTSGALSSFRAIQAPVLLLGGSQSPAYLRIALDSLEKTLPRAKRVELDGLNHGGSGNADRGGQPDRVAQELRKFFA